MLTEILSKLSPIDIAVIVAAFSLVFLARKLWVDKKRGRW